MNTNEMIGIGVSAVVLIAGMLQLEMIKSIVNRITSATGKENLVFSLLLLFVVTLIPAAVGHSIPEKEKETHAVEIVEAAKGKEEAIADAAIEGAELIVDVAHKAAEQVAEEKKRKEEAFESTREQRWVYMIGDWIDKGNDKALESAYNRIENVDGIKVLRVGRQYRFFREDHVSKEEADAKLEVVQGEIGSVPVKVEDIMAYCDFKNPSIKGERKDVTIGKRKNKVSIPAYTIGDF